MKKLSLIVLMCLWTAGCAESSTENSTACKCSSDQICDNGKCLDTCSELKPCPGKADCVNNICRGGKTPSCEIGTKKCSEDMTKVLVCSDGYDYETDEECGAGNICDSAVCVPDDCTEGTKRCHLNNVEVCTSNAFRIYTECELPAVCDETQMDCVTPSVCTNDVKQCGLDGNVEICSDGEWVRMMKCPETSPCDPTTFKCASDVKCQANEKSCDSENNLLVCNGTQWVKQQCPDNTICYNNDCREKCQPDTTSCVSQNRYRKCNAIGIWGESNCPEGLVCIDENGEASCEGTCTEGAYSCDDNVLKRCESNTINEIEPCGDRATCSETEGRCIPNCGNTLLDNGEECDTTVPSDKTCITEMGDGYTGTLSCTSTCTIDTGNCTKTSVTPPVGDWNYTQTFDSITSVANKYETENTFEENSITWSVKGRTKMNDTAGDFSIDGQGVIFKYNSSVPNYIKATGLTKGIKTLAFDYRSWGQSGDSGTIKITAGSFSEEISFKKDQTTPQPHTATVNAAATEFTIESTKGGRIIIDNVRWTNQ